MSPGSWGVLNCSHAFIDLTSPAASRLQEGDGILPSKVPSATPVCFRLPESPSSRHTALHAASMLHPLSKRQPLLPTYSLTTPCLPGAPVSSRLPQGEAELGLQSAGTHLMLGPLISPTFPVARKGQTGRGCAHATLCSCPAHQRQD